MSDDIVIRGDVLTDEEIAQQLTIAQSDIDDSIDWWNEISGDLFFGALEWNE